MGSEEEGRKVALSVQQACTRRHGTSLNPLYTAALFQAAPPPSGWPSTFAILTGCNPRGETESAEQNAKHDAQLLTLIQTWRCWHWRVIGGSPDFHHAEPGFAVVLPLRDALTAGQELKQEAIFWIENDELSVIACEGEARQKLGSWTNRLAQGNAVPRKAPSFDRPYRKRVVI